MWNGIWVLYCLYTNLSIEKNYMSVSQHWKTHNFFSTMSYCCRSMHYDLKRGKNCIISVLKIWSFFCLKITFFCTYIPFFGVKTDSFSYFFWNSKKNFFLSLQFHKCPKIFLCSIKMDFFWNFYSLCNVVVGRDDDDGGCSIK